MQQQTSSLLWQQQQITALAKGVFAELGEGGGSYTFLGVLVRVLHGNRPNGGGGKSEREFEELAYMIVRLTISESVEQVGQLEIQGGADDAELSEFSGQRLEMQAVVLCTFLKRIPYSLGNLSLYFQGLD